ncbi:PREDICTED: lysine-rich arabinogalactan protein 19-like [Nipponia nippon]|uniref:lysine-rich arabinogalactan protein 19-like n=1 Tax=Nipponia nippon TaxID=128390 RepID=UPI000510D768|nr:PREDICTED: lysine-rich arabinogalactan protein 19-like [Nipponia nippon]
MGPFAVAPTGARPCGTHSRRHGAPCAPRALSSHPPRAPPVLAAAGPRTPAPTVTHADTTVRVHEHAPTRIPPPAHSHQRSEPLGWHQAFPPRHRSGPGQAPTGPGPTPAPVPVPTPVPTPAPTPVPAAPHGATAGLEPVALSGHGVLGPRGSPMGPAMCSPAHAVPAMARAVGPWLSREPPAEQERSGSWVLRPG